MRLALAILAAACASAPASPAPAPVAAATPAAMAQPAACCDARPPAKDQPPELKLKLGHYASARRGIGLVFDRSTAQAKVRFDGANEIIKLDRQHGAGDRIDYIRSIGHVVLQQWGNGRVEVFVPGEPDSIPVVRDGDADPL